MNKIKIILAVIALACTSTAFADEASDYSADTGVRVIARSVLDKQLVDANAASVLELALETGRASFGKMECDRGLGSDYCVVEVLVHDDEATKDEAEETLYNLNIRIREGSVVSASLEGVAG